jgi:DNA modification methylase
VTSTEADTEPTPTTPVHTGDIVPYREAPGLALLYGDSRKLLADIPSGSVRTCVTSPPYWNLRDYGGRSQLGREATAKRYVSNLTRVFDGVRQVLSEDGTLWLNLGDCWRDGELQGLPWRVVEALRSTGWVLRADVIWHKPNALPRSCASKPTLAHEYLFMLTKSRAAYYYDAQAIVEPAGRPKAAGRTAMRGQASLAARSTKPRVHSPTRHKRTVWTVATSSRAGRHLATFPEALVEPCVLASSEPNDVVIDPFNGAGTTGVVALRHGRRYLGIDTRAQYLRDTVRRMRAAGLVSQPKAV